MERSGYSKVSRDLVVAPLRLADGMLAPRASTRGPLGPTQIEWLREKSAIFNRAWASVKASDEWAKEMRARVHL